MKLLLALVAFAALLWFALRRGACVAPAVAAQRLAAGTAILIDVREPAEWTAGVATPALLLPLSDLRGARDYWKPVLAAHREKDLLLYCQSGMRSSQAAALLAREGFRAFNVGSYAAWKNSGQPTRPPTAA